MKKKLLLIGLGMVLALLIVAVVVVATFKMPEFAGIDTIEVEELEGKDLKATIKTGIYNANFFTLTARDLEFLVSYHDTVLGKGELKEGVSLSSGDTTPLELPMTLGLQAIFALHRTMLRQEKCALDIHLEGEFTSLHYAQGMDFTTEIDPQDFLKDVLGSSMGSAPISMDDMTWKNSDLKSSDFGFVSVVKNPLDFPLELKAITLFFYSEGDKSKPAGNWQLDEPIALKPKYSTRVPGTVKIQHLAAGKGMVKTIFTGEIRYDTRGTLTLQIADLPFEIPIEGTIVVDPKTGKGRWE